MNFCKGTFYTEANKIVVWGIAIQYSRHELITQKVENNSNNHMRESKRNYIDGFKSSNY